MGGMACALRERQNAGLKYEDVVTKASQPL